MALSSGIHDNHHYGKVGDFLKLKIQPHSQLRFVSAYFSIFGFELLRDELQTIEQLQFLFGEPTFIKPIAAEKTRTKRFSIIEQDLLLTHRLKQKAIAKACADWIGEKVEIRSLLKTNLLHGKLYHIDNQGVEAALLGSSNFTLQGLGEGNSNIELNLVVDSDRDKQDLKQWFDKIWQDKTLVKDVKAEVLSYLEHFYIDNSPYFIYLKTLFHLFETYLQERQATELLAQQMGFYNTQIWHKLYDFQKDGVNSAITKINKHNGCIIADSVGLGKTFEALAVIKYFECRNARVLVICPKNLTQNWTLYQANQHHEHNPLKRDRLNYTVIYHTDVARTSGQSGANAINLENFHWESFDLVVIDESHNFRGNPVDKHHPNGEKSMNRAKWLMEKIIKSGGSTKVLLLSATPVNNSLRDLSNQIAFITEGKDDALLASCRIKHVGQTLKNAQTQFSDWAKSPQRQTKELFNKLDAGFFTILDELTIARSRKHIARSYNMDAIGHFPQRHPPISVYADIDSEANFPSYSVIDAQILSYKLAIFNPTFYVKDAKKNQYHATVGEQREFNLVGMMKVNFLKRLESSISSFEISLARTLKKIAALEAQITHFKTGQDSAFENLTLDDELEESRELWVGKKLKFHLADLKLDEWLWDLQQDKAALLRLHESAKQITPERDAKLQKLKSLISEKIKSPLNPGNQKVLIFTAFAETAQYLYDNLQQAFELNSALICGSYSKTNYGKNDYNSILTNFSPRSKERSGTHSAEIDLLIATDCISEGQNLQDCDYVVNYDIHWNPVRIIQRFGRIDRLGSQNKTIQLVNFWPTAELDSYINLKARVEARMVLVDLTATGDDNLLADEISDDLNYRHHQLERLKNEVLDLEELDESISLTDFTLDDFRSELLNGLDKIRQHLENSPLGLHALVPCPTGNYANLLKQEFSTVEKEVIKSGCIFCLRQKSENDTNEKINPLHPHFLVYIGDNGAVHYHYTHAKQILEVFKLLCEHRETPYDILCQLFNQETQNGEDVTVYSELLKKAVAELVEIVKVKGQQSLLAGRGSVLIPAKKQVSALSDFELITWLIIK